MNDKKKSPNSNPIVHEQLKRQIPTGDSAKSLSIPGRQVNEVSNTLPAPKPKTKA